MTDQRIVAVPTAEKAPLPVLTNGHHNGLKELRAAFAGSRPVAIIIGKQEFRPGFLIDRFLAEVADGAGTVRISKPGSDDDATIRGIARAAGFDLQEESLAGLQDKFRSYLAYQQHNNRRTVICFEDVQHDSRQALEIALRLARLEASEKFGLMLLLSGPPSLNKLLGEPPFDALCALAEQRIALGPFTLAETREHILREVEAVGFSDLGQVFEHDAITCIHEICAGVPDRIETLCCKCIELVAGKGNSPITADVANEAANLLWQEPMAHSLPAPAEALRTSPEQAPTDRLIARMHGVVLKEQALNNGHVLIGRSPLCDIHVDHSLVSRHHALVVKAANGLNLIDLGSTNGTFIGDRQVQAHTLKTGDVITIGDCQIAYVAGDD
jgi:type II secretory pathway predicted ATPase ExeA